MKESENKEATVTINREQLASFLDAANQVRTGFLMCAPRFAAGSSGERMVMMANEFGKVIEEMAQNLNAEKKE